MPKFAFLAVTVGLLSTTLATAQTSARADWRRAVVDRLFSHDENEDGKLSKDETPERLQRLFSRADVDHDGFLTRREIQIELGDSKAERPSNADGEPTRRDESGREHEYSDNRRSREAADRPGPPPERRDDDGVDRRRAFGLPNPLFDAIDANNDREITEDELRNAVSALKKLDENKDGRINLSEARPQIFGRGDYERGAGRREGREPGMARRQTEARNREFTRSRESGRRAESRRGDRETAGGESPRRPPIED